MSTLEPKAGSGLRWRASLAVFCARLSTGVLKPTCIGLATEGSIGVSEQFALFESSLRGRTGCATPPTLSLRRPNRNSFPGFGTFPSCPFSSGSSRGSGGSLRSVSATTTPCGSCSGPNRYRPGWMKSSRKSKRSAAPQPRSGRSFALNTTSGSASAGIATNPTSTGYSAFRWDPPASSGFANPPARPGIVSRSMPNPARST